MSISYLPAKIIRAIALVLFGLLMETSHAQFTDAEIQYYVRKVQERKILDQLAQAAQKESRQSATRADVLIACYQVIKEIDNYKIGELKDQVKKCQELLQKVKLENPANLTDTERKISQNIMKQIDERLKNLNLPNKQKDDSEAIIAAIKELRQTIDKDWQQADIAMEKKIKRANIIASAAVATSLVLTVMAAR